MGPVIRAVLLALILLAAGSSRAEEPPPADWASLKRAWAGDHLDLAREMLKRGCPGFADTQAGMARRLGAGEEELRTYDTQRRKLKPPAKGWVEADWKAYASKRSTLYRRHAKAAAPLLAGADAAEVEGWILQLDPDEPEVRKRRKERRVKGLGWLPKDVAEPLGKGLVRCRGVWEKPAPGKHDTWDKAYEIPTEHFILRSTRPHAEILAAAADLESLFGIWAELLEGIVPLSGRPSLPPVWLLKARADYRACVSAECPEIEQDARFDSRYGFSDPRGAFFHPEGAKTPIRALMLHEVTHLIHMSLAPMKRGPQNGFWCIEGAAVLMESLGQAKTVDWNAAMATAAHPRREVLARVDMAKPLLDLDRDAFYREDAATLLGYEQAWALSHFMLCARGGEHRRAFLEYLLAVIPCDADAKVFDTHFPSLSREALAGQAAAYLKTLP